MVVGVVVPVLGVLTEFSMMETVHLFAVLARGGYLVLAVVFWIMGDRGNAHAGLRY